MSLASPNQTSSSFRTSLLLSFGVFILLTASALSQQRGFKNSPHDFSNQAQRANSWNRAEAACNVCHVPHDDDGNSYARGLQWNHATTNATYMTYESSKGARAPQPSGSTKLCLSCHDGTIAIDDFKGSISDHTTFIKDYNPQAQIPEGGSKVNDLRRTHPVNVPYVYDPSDKDGLRNPSSPIGSFGTINDILENGKVVCSSCHDVHNNESLVGSPLLRAPMKVSQGAASGLCLACHKK